MKLNKFEKQCKEIADKVAVGVYFYKDKGSGAYQDDGVLHVNRRGTRAAFNIGQDLPATEYNAITRKILSALDVEITDSVLADENEVDDMGWDCDDDCRCRCHW